MENSQRRRSSGGTQPQEKEKEKVKRKMLAPSKVRCSSPCRNRRCFRRMRRIIQHRHQCHPRHRLRLRPSSPLPATGVIASASSSPAPSSSSSCLQQASPAPSIAASGIAVAGLARSRHSCFLHRRRRLHPFRHHRRRLRPIRHSHFRFRQRPGSLRRLGLRPGSPPVTGLGPDRLCPYRVRDRHHHLDGSASTTDIAILNAAPASPYLGAPPSQHLVFAWPSLAMPACGSPAAMSAPLR